MQVAAVPGYKLSRSKRSTRVLTTLGLIGILLGLLSAASLTVAKTGLTPTSVKGYYLGAVDGAGGLEGMLSATTRRPFSELAEVTHLHLTGGSLLLFLLCHLLSVCEVSERVRTVLYIVSFTGFLLTFGLPWGIVYLHPGFSWLFGPSIITFITSLIVLSAIPLWEMWWRR